MKKLRKKPRKQGRPPLPEGTARDKRLDDVRFSASELAQMKTYARSVGQTWTEWVRTTLGLG